MALSVYPLFVYLDRRDKRSSVSKSFLSYSFYNLSLLLIHLFKRVFPLFSDYFVNISSIILPLLIYLSVVSLYNFCNQIFIELYRVKGYRIVKISTYLLTSIIITLYAAFYITNNIKVIKLFYLFLAIYAVFFSIHVIINQIENRELLNKKRVVVFTGLIVMILFNEVYLILYYINNSVLPYWIVYLVYLFNVSCFSFGLIRGSNEDHERLIELNQELEKRVYQRTQQLEEEKEAKTSFFINLAHETKTPLTLIKNYLDKYIQKQGMNSDLLVIKKNIDKLTHDMVNFLDAEKLQKGLVFYCHDKVLNISSLLENKLELFYEIAQKKNIAIHKNIDKGVFLKIDPYAIDRVINNLLDNAIKFTPIEGHIQVLLIARENHFIIRVIDNGIGIPQKMHSGIFQPYNQISEQQRNISGIGMGLFITRSIVEQLKGKIKVKSESGKGSEFTIIFKRYVPSQKEEIIKDVHLSRPIDIIETIPHKEAKIVKGRKHILLVEDHKDLAVSIQRELEEKFNVYLAHNGQEGLVLLEQVKPDLIISDIMMDKMDGYEFINHLPESCKTIPFIFITACTTEDEKIKGLHLGAIDYMNKPFSLEELRIKVNRYLEHTDNIEKSFFEDLQEFRKNRLFQASFDDNCRQFKLTEKEKEVALFIGKGLFNKEIARELGISEETIKRHINHIYKKTNAASKVELINILKIPNK
ncbi:MAG: ATP-binding protein [Spirochaetes bacterium]|nr:ATP-binding protein [Spirochaetota bacterium]